MEERSFRFTTAIGPLRLLSSFFRFFVAFSVDSIDGEPDVGFGVAGGGGGGGGGGVFGC